MKRRFCIRLIGFMAAMGVGCCVQAEVVYSNDFNGAEFIAPGRSVYTGYNNAAEIGGQLVPTNGAVSGMLINLSALDLMGCYRILTDSAIAAIFGGECFADGQLDGGQPKTLTLTDVNLSRRSNLVDSR